MKTTTYDEITNRIIELLNQGVVPWRRPWTSGRPLNLHTAQPYHGINTLVLSSAPYESPYWVTFHQARERGGSVRKGERGWPITFWSMREIPGEGDEEAKQLAMLRRWTVFNVEQCDGVEYPTPVVRPMDDIAAAARIVKAMPTAPKIKHGGDRAFYRPASDDVQMPPKKSFQAATGYYAVLFHELIHSTGHPSRLNRPDIMKSNFGTQPYAKEELIAEMGAAMLCGEAGIAPLTIDNSASYIASWMRALRDDMRLLILAAGAAQKAAKYISPPIEETAA
jgi:antirestriction protein ArdC